jgi:osmoprotectant transport system substrate-binding protein
MLTIALAPGTAFSAEKEIVVGSKEFTEQRVLGEIMVALFDKHGFTAINKTGLGGTLVCHTALLNKQIDVYMEYTGTGLMNQLKHKEAITDPDACFDVVKKEYLEKFGLLWLPRMALNDTYCIMMRTEEAEKLGIKNLSQLADYVKTNPDKVNFGLNAEFYARPDGYKAMQKSYGFKFPDKNIVKMNMGLLYKALRDDEVNVAMGISTEGQIKAFNLTVLEDDNKFFPVYNAAPVMWKETVDKYPEIIDIFTELGPKLDNETITSLNYQVAVENKDAKTVARDWLKSVGMI